MKEIPLTQDKVAFVDEEDFEYLSQFNWYAALLGRPGAKKFYAVRELGNGCRKLRRRICMHRELCGATEKETADHRDGNPLNNQKQNLRACSMRLNSYNRRKETSRDTSSTFKGVSWAEDRKKWRASIRVDYRLVSLGGFYSEIDAARAYDEAAQKFFGEFASLNFPNQNQTTP